MSLKVAYAPLGRWEYAGVLREGDVIVWTCEHRHAFAKSDIPFKGQVSAVSCAKRERKRREDSDG